MLVVGVIVVVAAVAMVAANRYNRMNGHLAPGAMASLSLIDIGDRGLQCKSTIAGRTEAEIAAGDEMIAWSSIIEVAVVNRREIARKRFGFELLIEGHGLLVIDGSSPHGEVFLAHTHHLVGFDHSGLIEALRRRHARTVCYFG